MPKSRNRKNHKQKVAARNTRLQNQMRSIQKNIENYSKYMAEALEKKKAEEANQTTEAIPATDIVEVKDAVETK